MQKTRAKINISDDGSLMWYYFWGSSRVNTAPVVYHWTYKMNEIGDEEVNI